MSVTNIRALFAIIAGLLASGCIEPAMAQSMESSDRAIIAAIDNDGGYRPTSNRTYAAVRDRVIKARMLERLRDFLSPVRLPRSIGLVATECDGGDDCATADAAQASISRAEKVKRARTPPRMLMAPYPCHSGASRSRGP